MKNLRIKTKLILCFSLITLLTIVVGITGIVGMSNADSSYRKTIDLNISAVSSIADIRENFVQQRLALRAIMVDIGNPDKVRSYISDLNAYEADMAEAMAVYEEAIDKGVAKDGYNTFKNAYQGQFTQAKSKFVNAAQTGDYDAAMAALSEGIEGTKMVVADLRAIVSSVKESAAIDASNTSNGVFTTVKVQIIAVIFAAVIAMALCLYLSRMISRPLTTVTVWLKKCVETGDMALSKTDEDLIAECSKSKDEIGVCVSSLAAFAMRLAKVSNTLEVVAEGDFTVDFSQLSDSDSMGVSLRKVIDNLSGMLSEIYGVTAQVSNGSRQISDGAQSLANGTTEQAEAVEQLSSSISEISVKTKENAELAAKTAELAGAVKRNAEKGSDQMKQMLSAVKEIQDASRSISKVIKVIDDIAFQTNILALNAAVEAARAGQHGKGFAVVAEEVRSLAAKSAEAARDTASLIANSMDKSEFGARIASETADSLADIVSGIDESEIIINSIARSSDEQALAIEQINSGIEQVAHVVQLNSATAQESAASAEEMNEQAGFLEKLVKKFRTKETSAARHISVNTSAIKLDMLEKSESAPSKYGSSGKY